MKSKKIISIIIVIVAIISLIYVINSLRQNKQFTPKSLGDLQCMYTVTIQGNSMEPSLKAGSILSLNKCADKNNLLVNKIVAFKDKNLIRIGRIKEKLNLQEGVYYKITQDNRPNGELTTAAENILASE